MMQDWSKSDLTKFKAPFFDKWLGGGTNKRSIYSHKSSTLDHSRNTRGGIFSETTAGFNNRFTAPSEPVLLDFTWE